MMDFSKGWRAYELKIAFNLQSAYAMRFYELVANKTAKIIYKTSDLIKMFELEDKYKQKAESQIIKTLKFMLLKRHNLSWIRFRPILSITNFPKIIPQ